MTRQENQTNMCCADKNGTYPIDMMKAMCVRASLVSACNKTSRNTQRFRGPKTHLTSAELSCWTCRYRRGEEPSLRLKALSILSGILRIDHAHWILADRQFSVELRVRATYKFGDIANEHTYHTTAYKMVPNGVYKYFVVFLVGRLVGSGTGRMNVSP